MSDEGRRSDDGTARDVELAVTDLESAAIDGPTAGRVKGGLGGTPTPGGPVPIPYPTVSPSNPGTKAP